MKRALTSLLIASCCITFFSFRALAETNLGEVAFRQSLLDLGTDLRLMCVAAHPDDEDGATLAKYRKDYGYKTFAVIATRGEGGQNEIGPELYNALGVIRTHEMMGAAKITGAQLMFLNMPEFGYSKTLEETMRIWGHDRALGRLVRAIRIARPDVIISNHGTLKDHGNHQGVGALLREAFDIAGDATKFPEQLKDGLKPWQPARLYLRAWTPTPGQLTVNISVLDPLRGKTYAEIAADALRLHKSQGMGFFITRYLTGRPRVHYILAKSAPGGVAGAGSVPAPGGVLFDGLMDRVDQGRRDMSKSTAPRSALKKTLLDHADDGPAWNRAAACAAEIGLNATVDDSELVQGQAAHVQTTLTDYGSADAQDVTYSLEFAPWFKAARPASEKKTFDETRQAVDALAFTVPEDQPYTEPAPTHLFDKHFLDPEITAVARVTCGKHTLTLREPLYVDIAPKIAVRSVEPRYLIRQGHDHSVQIDFLLTNNAPDGVQDILHVGASSLLKVTPAEKALSFAHEGDERVVPVVATVPKKIQPGDYHVRGTLESRADKYDALVRVVDLKLPKDIRVGVIQSYDDTFVKTLERLGVPHKALTIEDFTPEKLDQYTTIIVDIRAYLVRKDLVANNQALLDYVKRGGTAIVMYQKTYEWKPEYAPYPITVSHNRVTVEDAPITLLKPNHPLFNTPNKIVPSDWDGWIQERGLYFPSKWDSHYTPLIATDDPGEHLPPGSCLITDYGKGTYFYTTLGWYRQLRELHPGVLRVFANMLAL